MKTLLIYILSLTSAFGQIGGIIASTANNKLADVQIATLSFNNPETGKVWRDGIQYSGTITPPSGYSTTWAIIDHCTADTVATGSGNTVTHTFSFVTMLDCNVYDLGVTITKGAKEFEQIYAGEFRCLPQDPGVYDQVINTAGDKNGGWTDRAGQTILITGDLSRINLYWWKSDDPTRPVHFILRDLHITTSTNIVSFGMTAMRNFIIDGLTTEAVDYGALVEKTTGAASQIVQLLGAEPNDNTKTSANGIICGIDANGNDIVGAGITAFRFLNNRDAANNESTFTFDNLHFFHCRGRNTYEEVGYFGQSSDYTSGGLRYPVYTDALFFDLIMMNGGNEVFQYGIFQNSEVFDCEFSNGGTRNQNSHENLVQWSNGNQDCSFYQNRLTQGTHNLLAGFSGETGKDNEFFSNVMYTEGKDADGGWNIGYQANTGSVHTTLNVSFFHNTIQWTDGVSAFTLYEAFTLDFDKFNSVENIVVGATTTNYENASGVDAAHVVFSNYALLTADIGNAMFVDHTTQDYHLSSLSSPAFNTSTSITKVHRLANYDFEGVKFVDAYPVRGAYSGYELMTLE